LNEVIGVAIGVAVEGWARLAHAIAPDAKKRPPPSRARSLPQSERARLSCEPVPQKGL